MHPTDKKQKFIELRANGQTLGTIAQALGVPKTTVWRWNQEEEEHIRELQLITQEEVEKEWHKSRLQRLVDLQTCSDWVHEAMIDQFRERADSLSLKELFLFQNLLRAEIENYRIKPLQRTTPDIQTKAPSQRAPQPQTEQNGTGLTQNGTPSLGLPSSRGQKLTPGKQDPTSPEIANPSSTSPQTEQNGTPSPENGTSSPLNLPPTSLPIPLGENVDEPHRSAEPDTLGVNPNPTNSQLLVLQSLHENDSGKATAEKK